MGPNLVPQSLMSCTHFSWSERPFAEIPMSFTPRFSKSGALQITADVKRLSFRSQPSTTLLDHCLNVPPRNLGELGRAHRGEVTRVREEDSLREANTIVQHRPALVLCASTALTQESPIHSWNLIVPLVVCASKSGAVSPRRSPIVTDG